MANIVVVSSSLVRMSKNRNAISHSKMNLNPWDLQFLPMDPIQKGILFYKPDQYQDFEKTILHQLKTSLSRTLDFFPPLAGRLGTIDNTNNTISYFIDCNNAGVEFTHAVAHTVYVSDILVPTYIPKVVSSFFAINETPKYEGISKPFLVVQVTELVDGFFVGLSASHTIMDGTSFWHFINSWSEISRGLDTISKKPIFERWVRTSIDLPISIPLLNQNVSRRNFVPPPLLERVFHFSKENLAKLKSKANLEAGTGNKISTLQALLAHLWQSIVRCRKKNTSKIQKQEVGFMILIGTRTRIPLPDGYFGNAVYCASTAITEHELLNHGLGYAAKEINELVNRQTKEAAVKFVEDWVSNPVLVSRGSFNFVLSSTPRHNVYGNDFGWGKPIAVRSGKSTKLDGKMTVFPSSEPGGIDMEVCLAPETLHAIGDDAEFMEAVTV